MPIKAASGQDTVKAQPAAVIPGETNGHGNDKSCAQLSLKGQDNLLP
jgi:hypothetical protein